MISKAKFVFSKSKVLQEYNLLKEVSDIICYSVKTNPYITNILEQETDSNFLIHHINELQYISDKTKILFMLHSPDQQELEIIFKYPITNFIVDNINDLNFLLKYISETNKKINLFLRMRLKEYTVNTGRYFVYGMYSSQINELIPKLKQNQNIQKLGIHFHRKTQNLSEWSLIRELEDSLSSETFKNIDFVDIGGGIPVSYKNTKAEMIQNVFEKINDLKQFLHQKNIKLIIEPGRAIAGPSGKLITHIKNVVDNTIIIDASVYNCSMDTIVSHIKLLVEGEDLEEKGQPYIIKGCTPASEDIFRYRVYFKKEKEPKIGDQLIFLNAGAYIYYTDLFNLEKPEIKFEE
ncbi:MAG TPA: decarboxylase [Candidatus Diapherotrites archaeon]|nr:decarboxylase [Candidatus Diapherotrites archaeon]